MSNFSNNNNLIHYIKYNIDKSIVFESSFGMAAFTLEQNEKGLIFKIPISHSEHKLSRLGYQINKWQISIIEYIINNNIAIYSSFTVHDKVIDYYFQIHSEHLLSFI